MEETTKIIHLTLEDYNKLIERAVTAECEAKEERIKRWSIEAEVRALKKTVESISEQGEETDG